MRLDLHLHTTCSDGQLDPAELARTAARSGLHAIAVTDHDTTAGVVAAAAAGAAVGLLVIAGIELSCDLDGADLHLLAYGITLDHGEIRALTERMHSFRSERLGTIVGRLRALGIAMTPDDVKLPSGNAAVGRPHVAQALVRLGVVQSEQEAFARFLADGRPAYVPCRGPDVGSAIAAVAAAGGLSVWAHPCLEDTRRFPKLREMGLDGVETLRPGLTPTASAVLEHAARQSGMVVSGGSDWHGGNPPLGSWYVTDRHVRGLLDLMGISQT